MNVKNAALVVREAFAFVVLIAATPCLSLLDTPSAPPHGATPKARKERPRPKRPEV
jgi:hypothetical protein